MSILPDALLIIASAVLVIEFGLTAAAGILVLPQGLERFRHLTGLTPSPPLYRLMGVLALAGVVGIIAGVWRPALAVAAATYFAALAGFTLVRQLQRGQRGKELIAYPLFLISALIVLVIRASELLRQ